MRLKILLPTEIVVDEEASKVIAEDENGSFCLLPRHVDFVTSLAPGILSFTPPDRAEQFFAVDGGILVKCGRDVLVSTWNAVRGPDLGTLKETALKKFSIIAEQQKKANAAMAKLESNLVRKFIELGEDSHE